MQRFDPAIREIVEDLVDRPWPGASALARTVRHYLEVLRDRHQDNELVDLGSAEQLAEGLLELLRDADEDLEKEHRQALSVAVLYFELEDDVAHDSDEVLGLEDDIEVFNAVARYLDRADLVIEID
jgi:translation initiation factor 2B subunit (eIF-2B alpha/beta/delta family)